jgi:hypothetical protein|tara:strand:- start:8370 stop:8570 length:201 start_codon:yes stop_codon:yes gene_type:complete
MKKDGEFSVKEKEWVSTASKYVDSKHLPILGQILKIVDTTSLMIGRAIFIGIILTAVGILGGKFFK